MKLTPEAFRRLPPEKQAAVKKLLDEQDRAKQQNPVLWFKPHSPAQHSFLAAKTPVQAAFCGNQFGKTCASVVKAFIQHIPTDALPQHLREYKRVTHDEPVVGWLDCPSAPVMESVIKPELRKWAPKDYLLNGSFDRAFDKQNRVLRFKDGGRLHLFSYEMDADKLVGAQVDYVIFDEPPPKEHWDEAFPRTLARSGCRVLALTPVNMRGGGIGWLYRDIYKMREDPDITVINGSTSDNPLIPKEEIERMKRIYAGDPQLDARMHGKFVHLAGVVYDDGFEKCLLNGELDPVKDKNLIRNWNVVVGIDPGVRHAAFVWVGFDSENIMYVFDEVRLNNATPTEYAAAIREVNAKWGITNPEYVIDPSARNRNHVNAENVEGNLSREGIYTIPGQNQVEAGIQQIRSRIQHRKLWVNPACRDLRDEAEEYRYKPQQNDESKVEVVKEKDHGLDATRYCGMHRIYDPAMDDYQEAPLGWKPGTAPSSQQISQALAFRPTEVSPLGNMS
jgi:phage terminase large subunit-like protein